MKPRPPGGTARETVGGLPQEDKSTRLHRWLLAGLILIAFGLYVSTLDVQSIWRDEGLTIVRSQQSLSMTLANRNIVQGILSPDLHPPLYFLLLHGWRLLAGSSEFALRFPSAVAMVLALAMFASVGSRIWGAESGYWAIALAALSPYHFWYAQEARMYACVLLETLVLLGALWQLLYRASGSSAHRGTGWHRHIALGVAAAVLIYTHYGGAFVVGFAVIAYIAARMERRAWTPIIIILIGAGLAAIPLYPYIRELITAPGFLFFSRPAPGTLLRQAVDTFSLGSADPMPSAGWRRVPFLLLIIAGALTLDVAPRTRRWRAGLVGVGGFLITIALYSLASWLQANYSNPRHLIIVSPYWFLLMGHGLATLRRRSWPSAALVGLAALVSGGLALCQTVADPPMVRDDVRGLADHIEERARPGDAVLWHNAVMMTTYEYYALDLPYTALPRYGNRDQAAALQELAAWTQPHRRIWFVSHPTPDSFDERVVPEWMKTHMVQLDSVNFPASWATLWLRLYRPPQMPASLPADVPSLELRDGSYQVRGVGTEPEAVAGAGTWLTVFWSSDGEPAEQPPSACVRLIDSSATLWSEGCTALRVPPSLEPPYGTLMEQQLWLPLPIGLAPVPYTMELVLGKQVQPAGTLDVQRPEQPQSLPTVARFDGGLELAGLEWAAEEFRAGMWAVGHLLWRAGPPTHGNLTATVRLVDWLGRTVAEQAAPLGPSDYPPQQWQGGELVRDRIAIEVPFHTEGSYRVQVSVRRADGASAERQRWSSVGKVRVADWPLVRDLPDDVEHRLDNISVDSSIRLLGYRVKREGDIVTVDLYWQSEREPTRDYHVFVHLGRPGEAPLAQASGAPANWTRPLESWRPGEIIADSHAIQLAPNLATEGLYLTAGMYDPKQPDRRAPLAVGGVAVPDGALVLCPLPE